MLEKYDIMTIDTGDGIDKDYCAVEILAINNIQHIICVATDKEGNLDEKDIIILKYEDNKLVKVVNEEELAKIFEIVGPYLSN